jgi:lipopolysaccharide transport system ATP-binding protein
LKDINLEVKKGEALGIIGANGAGKSTLLKVLSRVTAPTEGVVSFNGRISSMLEVGTGFHQELTGRENIYMNGAILGMSKKEVDAKIESIIDFSECRQFIDTPVKRYSSGMYVKLAFAVASHLDSEILIMDEVLAVGDMAFQKKSLDKMGDAAANEKRTVLYVSHNMATIRNLCTRCIVLDHGKLIFDGLPEKAIEIYNNANLGDYSKTYYPLDGLKRRDGLGTSEFIHSVELLNNTACIENDQMIKVKVKWTNKLEMEDLHLRIAFRQADSTNIGMCETDILQSAKKVGNHETIIQYDPAMLTDGNYVMVISLNQIHDSGEYEMRDEAPVLIPISISENRYLKEGKSRWIKKYWGTVRFPELEVLDEK